MSNFSLTELQYSDDRKGPFRLYVYRPDGYHSGGTWFRIGKMKYPDEEISLATARGRCEMAIAERREVRICDGGDNLVFHSREGRVLFGENFWDEIGGAQ